MLNYDKRACRLVFTQGGTAEGRRHKQAQAGTRRHKVTNVHECMKIDYLFRAEQGQPDTAEKQERREKVGRGDMGNWQET